MNRQEWTDVVRKYEDAYLRRLAIETHIVELECKLRKFLADDTCPFRRKEFNKELADLSILLELHKIHDSSFQKLVLERKQRFVEKLTQE